MDISFVFDTPHIYDVIFSALTPESLIQCSRSSRDMYLATKDFEKRAFDITKHLAPFFTDVKSFRTIQRHTGAIISGSNALQFMDRTCFQNADLDIYVSQNFAYDVAQWLSTHEGYTYQPSESQIDDLGETLAIAMEIGPEDARPHEPYQNSGLIGVFNFLKDGHPKIQMIATAVSPIHSVLSFHSTCVMNFITFAGAYSLYPTATFERRQAIAMGESLVHDAEAYTKYSLRGWKIHMSLKDCDDARSIFFADKTRRVLDDHTWIIPFETDDIIKRPAKTPVSAAISWDPALPNSWVLTRTKPHVMRYSVVYFPILEHRYLVGNARQEYRIRLALNPFDKAENVKRVRRRGEVGDKLWRYRDSDYPTFCLEYDLIDCS